MRWSLQELNAAKREPFIFDETLDLTSMQEQNNEIRKVLPIRVKGKANYSGSLITFTMDITGELILPCARTLADVHFQVDLHVTEKFSPADEYIDKEYADEEDVHLFEGDVVDLLPVIKEHIILEIPIQVYADADTINQAPQDGEGWEFVTDEQKKNRIDPRLADLAKFFDKE